MLDVASRTFVRPIIGTAPETCERSYSPPFHPSQAWYRFSSLAKFGHLKHEKTGYNFLFRANFLDNVLLFNVMPSGGGDSSLKEIDYASFYKNSFVNLFSKKIFVDEWIVDFYSTLNKIGCYSDSIHFDAEDGSVPAEENAVLDALAVYKMLKYNEILPGVELLGDGSILFAWCNHDMVGGFRFIGDRYASYYLRDCKSAIYSKSISVSEPASICRAIACIIKSLTASSSNA